MNKEILWIIVNSGLAGLLVFFGSITQGQITWEGILAAGLTSAIVALTKFKEFWTGFMKKKKGSTPIFEFIKIK